MKLTLTPVMRVASLAAVMALTGCAHNGHVQPGQGDWKPVQPVAPSYASATPGAIFQAGRGMSLFVDHRAMSAASSLLVESRRTPCSADS